MWLKPIKICRYYSLINKFKPHTMHAQCTIILTAVEAGENEI